MRWKTPLILTVFLLGPCFARAAAPASVIPDQEISLPDLKDGHVPVVRVQPTPRPRPAPRPVTRASTEIPKPAAAKLGPKRPAPRPLANVTVDSVEMSPLDASVRSAELQRRKAALSEDAEDDEDVDAPASLDLTTREFVGMVHQRNQRLLAQRLEWLVAEESVANARSIFEPDFIGTASHDENQLKNTVQESLQRSNLANFTEYNEHYEGAVEKLLPTGGRVRSGYKLDSYNNNLQAVRTGSGLDTFNEFRTFLSTTLTQPLLRNRGPKVTKARIHVAEKDRDIAFQTYRREMMRILAESISAYMELLAAQERLGLRQESIRVAEFIIKTNKEKVRLGLMAETEILEAEAGLAQRRALEQQARQDVITATARIRNFISATPDSYEGTALTAADELDLEPVDMDLAESLRSAIRLAPEYLSAKSKLDREGIRVGYAKNQRWPQLDMRSTYGLNGLGTVGTDSLSDSFKSDNKTWNVLMEFRIPLEGSERTRSELKAAEYHKKQAVMEIKTTEVELSNAVDTAIKNVQSAQKQVAFQRDVRGKAGQLLKVELQRLESGMSNCRLVLQREEELNKSHEEVIRGLQAFKRASLELDLTRGTLLNKYGVDTDTIGISQSRSKGKSKPIASLPKKG